jgi:hypothetical protein
LTQNYFSNGSPKIEFEIKAGIRHTAETDVMIFKIFSPKNSAKKLAFLTQNKAKLCKIFIITLVFEKNANFFAENCRKSPKIVIITSVPGRSPCRVPNFSCTKKVESGDYCQFSAKNGVFFSETNAIVHTFAKTSSSLSKIRQMLAKLF